MKKLYLLVLTITLILGCQKDDIVLEDPIESIEQENLKLSLKQGEASITITPSGDVTGLLDANAIETALNNVKQGGTVLLETGTFYVNKTIAAPIGFKGTLRGVGKNETEIIGVGTATIPFNGHTIFSFLSPKSSITVSDFSLSLPADFITNINGYLNSFIEVSLGDKNTDTHFYNLILLGTDYGDPNSIFNNSPFNGIEVNNGSRIFYLLPSAGGSHSLRNSEISKVFLWGIVHQGMKNATISVANNTFIDIGAIASRWLNGCNVTVQNNYIEASVFGSILVTQERQFIDGSNSSVSIKNNQVFTEGLYSVEIGPIPEGGAGFDLSIQNNTLNITDGGIAAVFGILINSGNDNASVKNNIISGQANHGINQLSNLGMFKDNDLSSFNGSFDYNILGDFNTLKGVGAATVNDEGTGNTIMN